MNLLFSKKSVRKISFGNIFVFILVLLLPMVFSESAQAGNLTETVVRLDRMKASTATSGTVCAKPTTIGTETTVKVTFPTGFTVNSTAANWTTTTTNLPLGATVWPGIGTASLVASQDVTFPSTDLAVGTLYCFNFSGTSTLTNSTAGNDKTGVVTLQAAGPATIDTGSYALSIISDDQISVSATVVSTFTVILGGTSDSLGTISTSATTSSSGVTAEIRTNAASGWTVWVKSANAALNSASTSGTITSPGSYDGTPETLGNGYVLDVDLTSDSATAGTGTVTINSEYNGGANSGGHLDTTFNPVASANGVTDADVITLVEKARISSIQKAASDYVDTLTIVASGLF